jgi:hypothetical protein
MQFLVVQKVRLRFLSADTLLKACSESFGDFINNMDHDPRFKNTEDDDDGFVNIDDL